MGLFSSQSKTHLAGGDKLAEVCFSVREEMNVLGDFAATRVRSGAELLRLQFSRDVLLILMGAAAAQMCIQEHEELMEINERSRSRYLDIVPLPPTSLVGDCVICQDEVESVGRIFSPGSKSPQILSTPVSTKGIISMTVDYRAPEFRSDFYRGLRESKVPSDYWLPVARRFIYRIRGGSPDEIPFDDVNHFAVALLLPFTAIRGETAALL